MKEFIDKILEQHKSTAWLFPSIAAFPLPKDDTEPIFDLHRRICEKASRNNNNAALGAIGGPEIAGFLRGVLAASKSQSKYRNFTLVTIESEEHSVKQMTLSEWQPYLPSTPIISSNWRQFSLPIEIRSRFAAVALDRDSIFLLGGETHEEKSRYLSDVVQLSVDSCMGWNATAVASLPSPRSDFSAVLLGQRILAIGGQNNGCYLDNVDMYDAVLDRWEASVKLPVPISLSASVATNDGRQVYVTGGIADTFTSGMNFLLFDVRGSRWNFLSDLPRPRSGHAAIMDAEGYRLYVIGGI